MFPVDGVIAALELTEVAPDTYRAGSVQFGHNVVHGGQLMAQSVVAGLLGNDGKTVKTLHTVFTRSARPDVPLDVAVRRVHAGRSAATSLVTIS
nr:thioesterase family protein [Micromonospora sp. DSM 115978]